jgi:hypothetical protein
MASAVQGVESKCILSFSRWDTLLIALAAFHGVVLAAVPTVQVVAVGVWWNSNTISHNFIHRPFFRSQFLNLFFSSYLSILLGIPQALWRDLHLAHHAAVRWRLRISPQLVFEASLVVCVWAILALSSPHFFLAAYLPGYFIGLGLCALQGHYEHAHHTTSHYGSIYNFLFFNDGYHVEHHANPRIHWTRLPEHVEICAHRSQWPAVLRWLDIRTLEALENLVLRSRCLQQFVLRSHRRAFRALIPQMPPVRRAAIVGGGLFPRTALILQELLPAVQIIIIDANPQNLETARSFVGGNIEFVNERYVPGDLLNYDLVVIPLSFEGERRTIYHSPPSPAVLVHDWIWCRRGVGRIVSVTLLKRLNLVMQ